MSGIIGSRLNNRGSGLVGSLGTDGQALVSSGAGNGAVFETVASDLTPVRQDILTLALKQAVEENHTKYNLPNSSICKFEADADFNLAGSTTIGRNASEYISSVSSSYTTYTSGSSNFTVPAGVTSVEVLVVAGGGGGRASDGDDQTGAGGGAGGVVHHATLTTTPAGTIAYAVGAGGAGGTVASRGGTNGSDSTFGSITAVGGGATSTALGVDGGSGSGVGLGGVYGNTPGSGTQGDSGGGTGYGNDGGSCGVADLSNSAGGGGAGAVGANTVGAEVGSAGGAGRLFSNFTSYGVSGYFAGGGGGGGETTNGAGGSGGGGAGGEPGVDATANTGSGGGGSGGNSDAGDGGSGFIGIYYQTLSATGTALGTTNVPTSAVTDVSGVMLLKDASGTTTLGTDVKAYFTADNSNWTEATSYADAGTFSTGIKMIKLGKATCTSGSDVRWKIAFANQVASSKEAYIYGIGLNY